MSPRVRGVRTSCARLGQRLIIAVLGGSAPSTPTLAQALSRSASRPVTLRLVGRNPQHLRAVTRACAILCEGSRVSVAACDVDRWRDAISGADIALIQVRQGGYAGRAFDERFPRTAGVPGDEGLGPGGLSAAYRTWPVLRHWLAELSSHAPYCRIILVTSPGGLLVRLAHAEFPRLTVVHPCELPFLTLQELCASCEVPWEDASFDYVGHNHMGWFLRLKSGGTDVLARYRASGIATFPSSRLVSELGGFPLKYLRLHYEPLEVLREQAGALQARGDELVGIGERAHRVFAQGDLAAIQAAMSTRPARWHEGAVVPLIRAWMGDDIRVPLFLTRSDGAAQLEERHHVARQGRVEAVVAQSRVPPAMRAFMDRITRYEGLATIAIQNGSEADLEMALKEHPWVPDGSAARSLARNVFSQGREVAAEGGMALLA